MHNILIVDDEEIFCTLLESSLRQQGYSVRCVLNGREAIAVAGREAFDVVITDLHMPDLDGFEVVRQIKANAPATVLIMITGNSSPEMETEAYASGVDAFFRKPFAIGDLLAHLPPVPQPV